MVIAVLLGCLWTAPGFGLDIDCVLVLKDKEKLYLVSGGKKVKAYDVVLGWNPDGPKRKEGDGKTPEGTYVLDYKKKNSSFYKSIHISYPNRRDRALAESMGVDPGGAIMIHGRKNSMPRSEWRRRKYKWTNGCIQVSNRAMDEIWDLVRAGTPIEIRP